MGKREKLCPEITDVRLRGFLDMVPSVRAFQKEAEDGRKHFGRTIPIELPGREITVCFHEAEGEKCPVLFEFHGGGFVFGDARKDDRICHEISERCGCHVIGVNYRLAPEHPYPAAVNDAYDIVCYFKAHAAEFGIDPEKMAVMGYSAGATLAAVTAMRCKKEKDFHLCGQVLHYPYLDSVHLPGEKRHYDCDMDLDVMTAFTLLYSKEEERVLPYVSPVCASMEDLCGIAPACILPAKRDGLKDEGLEYAKLLERASVEVYCQTIPDTHHGYIEDAYNEAAYEQTSEEEKSTHSPYFKDWAAAALGITCSFLKNQWEKV